MPTASIRKAPQGPSDPYQRWLGVEGLSEQKHGETRTSADVSIYNWHYVGAKPKTEGEQAPAPATQGGTGAVHNETYIGDPDDLPL